MSSVATVEPSATAGQFDALFASQFMPRFPAAWAVPLAASTLWDAGAVSLPVGTVPEGPAWFVSVAPGRIRIGRQYESARQRRDETECHRRQKRVAEGAAWRSLDALRAAEGVLWASGLSADVPMWKVETGDRFVGDDPLGRFASRSRIVEWSAKSRSNMMDRLSTLDYAPLMAQGLPALVTATLPSRWLWYAPTGKAFKALVRAFAERYYRAWGRRLRGLWKLEFQRRGAPHLHALMVPPTGTAGGMVWRDWYAATWADVCVRAARRRGLVDAEDDRARMVDVHSHHTASANYAEGMKGSDPKRIAVYFLKHNILRDKEYQHIVPSEWHGEGDGPGRFWGYWDLERADKAVPVTSEDAIRLARTLRRWQKSTNRKTEHGAPIKVRQIVNGRWVAVAAGPTRRASVERVTVTGGRRRELGDLAGNAGAVQAPELLDSETGANRRACRCEADPVPCDACELGESVATVKVRRRTVRRRLGSMRGTAGYLVVNDGPAVGLMLAESLRKVSASSGRV